MKTFRITFALTLLLSLALGGSLALTGCHQHDTGGKPADVDYYTCTMHPSVKSQDPKGKCPICSMDLVPVMKKGVAVLSAHQHAGTNTVGTNAPDVPTEFTVAVQRQQQIGVTYAAIEKHPLALTVRAVGTVAYDKQRHWD